MSVLITDLVPFITVVAAIIGITMTLINWRKSVRRRTAELLASTDMLSVHYDAVTQVVDDPALPAGALEALVWLVQDLQDERFVQAIVMEMMNERTSTRNGSAPEWFAQIEALRSTRPDLANTYDKAVATGIVGSIARYRSTASMLPMLAEVLAAGNKRQAIIADRAVRHRRHDGGNHLPPSSGVAMPA